MRINNIKFNSIEKIVWILLFIYIAFLFSHIIGTLFTIINDSKNSTLLNAVANHNLFFWPEEVFSREPMGVKLLSYFDLEILHTGGWLLFVVNLFGYIFIAYLLYLLLHIFLKSFS